jgi:uncharacterized protein YuzE
MKITYDPQVDVLKILLYNLPIAESNETEPGMIIDYDQEGKVVGMEILNASQRIENPYVIEYSVATIQLQAIRDKLTETQASLSLKERRAFLQLPLEERRRIMAEQAEALAFHYEQDSEWQELQIGDVIDY